VIGIGLSLIWLVHVATHPRISELGQEVGTSVFRDLEEHPDDVTYPGVVVLRVDGGVFFATCDVLEDRVRSALLTPGVAGLVLHLAGVNFVDSQGATTISEIVQMSADAGADLRLASVRPAVRRVLDRGGVVDRLGTDHLHGNLPQAVAAAVAAAADRSAGPAGPADTAGPH